MDSYYLEMIIILIDVSPLWYSIFAMSSLLLQLSMLSLMLKAREYDKKLFKKDIEINIVDIKESNSITKEELSYLNENNRVIANQLIETYKDSKEYGSILKTKNNDLSELINELNSIDNIFIYSLKDKISSIIKQDRIMNSKFDVVVTNPPYLNA